MYTKMSGLLFAVECARPGTQEKIKRYMNSCDLGGCHCGYHVSVRHLCSFNQQPQRHHFGSREDEHRGCGIDQFDDEFAFNGSEGLDCMKVDNCKLQKFLSSTRSTLPAQSS